MIEVTEKEFYRMLDQLEEDPEWDEEEAEAQRFDPELNEWHEINMKDARIQNRRINQLCFSHCVFENVVFDDFFIYDLYIRDCTFINCYFKNLQIDQAFVEEDILMDIRDSNFLNCRFENITIEAFQMQSDMGGTKFYQTKFEKIYFGVDIALAGCSLKECELERAEIIVNEIFDNLFEKMIIKDSKIQAQFSDNIIKNTEMIESVLDIVHFSKY